ncbi:hypothetical protein RJ639_001883 [Escallonia herrerae]|uniref:Retrotransposon Copia-like N-terminal domain-containing protein n=1 Tax=Escallonia herrerae TaxID=1293975 RepID=A0AA88X9H7_9ASTE|nr:hypothetical protein RJ639_001883 [Escallonia herrerae]
MVVVLRGSYVVGAVSIESFFTETKAEDDGKDATQRKTISPYDLTTNDNPGIIITQVQLKGKNYDEWAGSIQTAMRARKKFGFIDGTIKRPNKNS